MMNQPSKVVICKKLQQKFSQHLEFRTSEEAFLGCLFGWEEDDTLVCLAASKDQSFLPSGLHLVGAFYYYPSGSMSEQEMVGLCENEIDKHMEDFANSHYVVILKVEKAVDQDKTSVALTAQLLSLDSRLTSPAPDLSFTNNDDIMKDMIFVKAKGQLSITFDASEDKELLHQSVTAATERYRVAINSGLAAFALENSSLLLRSLNEEGQELELVCEDLYGFIEDDDDGFSVKTKSKKKNLTWKEKEPLRFSIMLQTTGDAAVLCSSGFTPVIHYQRRNFHSVSMALPIDVIAMVSTKQSSQHAIHLLTDAISNQLSKLGECIVKFSKGKTCYVVEPYHFWPNLCGHPVTVLYPDGLTEDELQSYRLDCHRKLLLPDDRPMLRKACEFEFPGDEPDDRYLKNTHIGLPPSGVQEGITALVDGTYTYHHYMQDRADDNGWGCAYRSLQTIVSWFRFQGYVDKPVPTHREIQQALVDVGDKPASFVGSKKWIGSQEVSYCLNHLFGITSKIMFVSSGAELANKGRELINHFLMQGTPIMIGGGVLAHTILGVDFSEKTGEIKFLILDPHYTGAEDLHVIQSKGWCGWKSMDFWDQTAFYNLCLPQRPKMI